MGFLTRLYQKVLISIDIDVQTCKILVTHFGSAKKGEEKTFKTINGDLPIEAAKYIRHIKAKFPFSYVSTTSKAQTQGLINGNRLSCFEEFNLSISSLHVMLVNKKWFVYIAKDGMIEHRARFSKIGGTDFVFSPFCLIYERVKSRLEEGKKLYILQERGSCALMIADNAGVYFGNYITFNDYEIDERDEELERNNDIVEFEEIGNIDENIIVKDFDNKQDNSTSGLNDLNIANTMINVIKDTLNSFYKDDKYASDFIEELLILDACDISDNAISYLTNNMMLDIQFLRINICLEIEKLAKMELKL